MDTLSVEAAAFAIADPDSSYLIVFVPVQIIGEPRTREHSALIWQTPEALTRLPLAPSDKRYVEMLARS